MTQDPAFVPGLRLARLLYEAIVPLLNDHYPQLRYSAARIGRGSDVLGYDTARSADHDWGPRVNLFLTSGDATRHSAELWDLLARRLPERIAGWPTNFTASTDPNDPVSFVTYAPNPVNHGVAITDADSWWRRHLGRDPAPVWDVEDWLAVPQQRLAEVTGGEVFHDGLDVLRAPRRRLEWYPENVWRYLLACQWHRIAQEEPFVGRCAQVGDELGARVVTARLVRDVMRLSLLLGRRYAPYSKWLGSAFAQLPRAARLHEPLRAALDGTGHEAREEALCAAYRLVAQWHNELGLTEPLDPAPRKFHSRPFWVIDADRFTRQLIDTIDEEHLRQRRLTGGIDQWVDSTDHLSTQSLFHCRVDNTKRYPSGSAMVTPQRSQYGFSAATR